jgi:hypothetical protein
MAGLKPRPFKRTPPKRHPGKYSVCVRPEKKPQISPLRYAPVEKTNLFGNANHRFQDELPFDRSVVIVRFRIGFENPGLKPIPK